MNVLIVGGTGNISTPITQRLIEQGARLTLFTRGSKSPDWLRNVTVIKGDRTHRAEFAQKLANLGPFDCVIDMLCFEPEDAACDVQVFRGRTRQFIFCSTVDIYSKTPAAYPVSEERGVIIALPSFPYAYKKVECERILWEAQQRGDFPVTVMRPAFTYSDSWSPGIHSFGGQTYHLDRLRKGKPILLHGDGTSIWVATHSQDVARAFVSAIGNSKAMGQAYNLTGDEWMTHNHIWRTIARVLKAPEPEFVYVPTDLLGMLDPQRAEWCVENFRHNNIFDNTKAKRDLGFRYTIAFEEGVRRCIDCLEAQGRIEPCENHPFYDRMVELWRRHRAALIDEYRAGSPGPTK